MMSAICAAGGLPVAAIRTAFKNSASYFDNLSSFTSDTFGWRRKHLLKDANTFHHGVVVNLQDLPERALVAPGEIPGDRYAVAPSAFKNNPVSFLELQQRQPASKRIVDVGIGASLIEDDLTV